MKTRIYSLLALSAVLCFSGCTDEESQIPTVPTSFGIEDGAEISATSIRLTARGSFVEDKNTEISYTFFFGKSPDMLEETTGKVTLEPYTQYFWRAQAKTDVGESEMTDILTFYCVPEMDLLSDNGKDEWAAIIRWGDADMYKSVTISATSNNGHRIESVTVDGSLGSHSFTTTTPERDAYIRDWNDAKGIYYEPIIYTFNVEAKVQVGDKLCTATGSIREIFLDKNTQVRDHEFNVYRLINIGNRTWLADDFRAKTDIHKEALDCIEATLNSGAVGVLYHQKYIPEWTTSRRVIPKGFHIASDSDWADLESYYGLKSDKLKKTSLPYLVDTVDMTKEDIKELLSPFQGVEQAVGKLLKSPYDWHNSDEFDDYKGDKIIGFNAKPFGSCDEFSDYGLDFIAVYYTTTYQNGYRICRALYAYSDGILRYTNDPYYDANIYASIRLVKD